MTQASDPWSILGVRRDATVRDVKRRYAQLLKLNRPDDAPESFAQLRRVYEICLAQAMRAEHAMQAVETVDIIADEPAPARDDTPPQPVPTEPEPVVAPEPLHEPPPAEVVEVSLESLRLERLAPLRRPAVVVDELLVQAGASRPAFEAWLRACPELANFSARDAVEIELLSRLAAGELALPARALNTLDAHFAWGHHDTRRRLAANVPGVVLERLLPVLDRALVEARFEAHLDSGEALYKPGSGKSWNNVLGDAARENALLREMHAARGEKPRWWRALRASTVANVNNLLYAYAAHHGHAAADQLFGARSVRFWQRALPNAPPNLTHLGLKSVRGLIGIAGIVIFFMVVLSGFNGKAAPALAEYTRLATILVTVYFGYQLPLFGLRWVREVGIAKLRILRLRMLDYCERFLQPRFALPVLVAWNVPAIWFAVTHSPTPVLVVGVAAVGVLIGVSPLIGAALLAWAGAVVFPRMPGIAPWQIALFAANVPTMTWLIDRLAVRVGDWHRTRSGRRDAITLTLLVQLAILIAIILGR